MHPDQFVAVNSKMFTAQQKKLGSCSRRNEDLCSYPERAAAEQEGSCPLLSS